MLLFTALCSLFPDLKFTPENALELLPYIEPAMLMHVLEIGEEMRAKIDNDFPQASSNEDQATSAKIQILHHWYHQRSWNPWEVLGEAIMKLEGKEMIGERILSLHVRKSKLYKSLKVFDRIRL